MPTRRAVLAGAGAALAIPGHTLAAPTPIDHGRPPPSARHFSSPAIERAIADVSRQLGSAGTPGKLAAMFANCFPNTLDTTVEVGTRDGRPDTFVLTGDIHAMWLRDSTAQVWPYLRFAREDPALARLLAGVVERQTRCVLLDPYANAFNKELTPSADFASDETAMKPGLHERKWELDSLCSVIRLAHGYWRATGDTAPFTEPWRRASRLIVETMRVQQRKNGPGPYRFRRETRVSTDTAPQLGYGNPVRPVGLIASTFRPSDDATIFPFLVPANIYAVVALRQLATMHERIARDAAFAADCRALAAEVETALRTHALIDHPRHGRVWAYEVDGFGNTLFMDDANVPSLLSLPYLGWCEPTDPDYHRTRALVLGDDNPYFHRGRAAEGIGSPHTPGRRVWPIAMAMRAMTASDEAEVAAALRMLATTDAGTGFMHEAVNVDDPNDFSRPWFAWANTLFGEMMLDLLRDRPRVFERL